MAQCKRPLSQFSPRPGERKSQSTTAAILSLKLVDVCALVPLLLVLLWSKYQVVATAHPASCRSRVRKAPRRQAARTPPSCRVKSSTKKSVARRRKHDIDRRPMEQRALSTSRDRRSISISHRRQCINEKQQKEQRAPLLNLVLTRFK
jgi:hypothetical protein